MICAASKALTLALRRPAGYVCFSPGPDALSWLRDWSYGRSPQAAYDAWKRKQLK